MPDIDDLKKKKMEELKSQMDQEDQQKKKKQQLEQQKRRLLKKILTSEARGRLSNLRMARPEFTQKVEMQLIQLSKTGRIDLPIDDDQLKKILKKLQDNKKSINIKRK